MSNLIELLKNNIKTIMFTIVIYQMFLTIFFYSTENLVILAFFIVIAAAYVIITTYKNDIIGFFKK